MKKIFYLFLASTALGLAFSCTDYDDANQTSSNNLGVNVLNVDNGIITLSSKQYLNQIVKDYKSGVAGQNEFNNKIKSLQKNGFNPLTPIFTGLNETQIKEFVSRKKERLNQRNIEFGLYARDARDYELELDDDLIKDPVLAALLNEKREIIIADVFYKYTELGLLFINKDDKQLIYDYLDSFTPEEKRNILMQHRNEYSTTDKPQEKIEDLGNGLTAFRMLLNQHDPNNGGDGEYGGGGGYGSGPDDGNLGGVGGTGAGTVITPGSGSGNTGPTMGDGVFNPASFGGCDIEEQGLFEQIFGASESCTEYYNDDKRVKVSFWNQNFHIYSSIGASTEFQKRECWTFFDWSICWWEKSYADHIKLGINSITFNYDFNVPMYNQYEYDSNTVFFAYNGTRYNINGQVITTVPTGNSSFDFPVNDNNNVIDIVICQDIVGLNNGQINQAFDALWPQIQAALPWTVRAEVSAKKDAGTLEERIVYAVPNSNTVKFIVANQNWGANDDYEIVHYFDVNFLLTYNSNMNYDSSTTQGVTNILQGLNGATSYGDAVIDLYGAALHNNYWKGRRLFTGN